MPNERKDGKAVRDAQICEGALSRCLWLSDIVHKFKVGGRLIVGRRLNVDVLGVSGCTERLKRPLGLLACISFDSENKQLNPFQNMSRLVEHSNEIHRTL